MIFLYFCFYFWFVVVIVVVTVIDQTEINDGGRSGKNNKKI